MRRTYPTYPLLRQQCKSLLEEAPESFFRLSQSLDVLKFKNPRSPFWLRWSLTCLMDQHMSLIDVTTGRRIAQLGTVGSWGDVFGGVRGVWGLALADPDSFTGEGFGLCSRMWRALEELLGGGYTPKLLQTCTLHGKSTCNWRATDGNLSGSFQNAGSSTRWW